MPFGSPQLSLEILVVRRAAGAKWRDRAWVIRRSLEIRLRTRLETALAPRTGQKARADGRMKTLADLKEAIVEGAVKRLRPKVMTVAVMFMGLVPIMWSTGAGSDVMRRSPRR